MVVLLTMYDRSYVGFDGKESNFAFFHMKPVQMHVFSLIFVKITIFHMKPSKKVPGHVGDAYRVMLSPSGTPTWYTLLKTARDLMTKRIYCRFCLICYEISKIPLFFVVD